MTATNDAEPPKVCITAMSTNASKRARAMHVPTIKPIDADMLVAEAKRTGRLIVVEEQSVIGGLGGAVAEVLSERYPVLVSRLGIQDCYGESGPNEALLDRFRLSGPRLADDIESVMGVAVRPPAALSPDRP